MIRLTLGENTLALTLTEKVSIVGAGFLFEFKNNQTQKKAYCIAVDVSLYPERYNKFVITGLTGTPNPLNGEIKLNIGDEYIYTVYEQVGTTNLDPTGLNVVETGMMIYDKVMELRNEYDRAATREIYEV